MTDTLARPDATLDDKYRATDGWVYMTGIQALVRLPIQQRLRDAALGWNTGGYISGYRGSPVGRYDMELNAAADLLKQHNIQFRPGLNEDLAATAAWGSQYVGSFPGAKVDGVFALWYGKGPGVDRSGDALRHANLAGTSPRGGVLCIAGDDHGAKSSTVANFSDPIFMAVGMPVLYPSNTQELLDFGLHGIAMSRHSGCWVGMKVVTDVVEGGGSVRIDPLHPVIDLPPAPAGEGMAESKHIRAHDKALDQERRLYGPKLDAALAYARANRLNPISERNPRQEPVRIGIISAGKAWQDTLQALGQLGLGTGPEGCALRMLKVGMVWPLDPLAVAEFAQGLDTVIVVEEKRPVLEDQVRALLYGSERPPRIVGKYRAGGMFDPQRGAALLPPVGELNAAVIAATLASLLPLPPAARLEPAPDPRPGPRPVRAPTFCSGCPHGRSTQLPTGSRALAGIGCHGIASLLDPARTTTISHMGGEGVMWLGQHAFTEEAHVFANLGDGTLSHSGFLAVRQAVAANVPITYKILFNGFVSMTGGQSVETAQTPQQILAGMAAEGVRKMAVVTDEVEKYQGIQLPPGVTVHPREDMEALQVEFRQYGNVSIILYDQPCATERRRLRKRGKWADPDKRVFINPAVCEGCGDCSTVSGCMSIEPLETEFGRKRKISQDSCNKDFSCVEGFCPSFVTVRNARVRKPTPEARKGAALAGLQATLPEPALPALDGTFSVLIAGIGGTGVVTIGQTLAMAAHLDGRYCSNLDITGLSQKYGSVTSHVRMARSPELLHATRIGQGETRTLIGCDLIASTADDCLATLARGVSRAVVSTDLTPTQDFARNPDWSVDVDQLRKELHRRTDGAIAFFESQRLAQRLMGDPVAANMFMLGAAWQQGLIPVSRAALMRAIEINGVAVALNQQAFTWGRLATHDLARVEALLGAGMPAGFQRIEFALRRTLPLDELIAHRSTHLTAHTGTALAERYRALVQRVRAREEVLGLPALALTTAVAKSYHRLLAEKDEWEVARLYSLPDFRQALRDAFDGDLKIRFHLGAWPLARKAADGRMHKREVGAWVLHGFAWMARLRGLRGTWLDPFRHGAERRLTQALTRRFEEDVELLLGGLTAANHTLATQIAGLMDTVRGYGHVKERHAQAALARRDELWSRWERDVPAASAHA